MLKYLNEDNDLDFNQDVEYLNKYNDVNKELFFKEIKESGEERISEIKKKEIFNNIEKQKLIKKITKKNNKISTEELSKYSIKDIRDIYNETKEDKSTWTKIIHFIFGFE